MAVVGLQYLLPLLPFPHTHLDHVKYSYHTRTVPLPQPYRLKPREACHRTRLRKGFSKWTSQVHFTHHNRLTSILGKAGVHGAKESFAKFFETSAILASRAFAASLARELGQANTRDDRACLLYMYTCASVPAVRRWKSISQAMHSTYTLYHPLKLPLSLLHISIRTHHPP